MDLQFYGANTIRISTKKASVIIDDNLAELGKKSVTKSGDVVLFTGLHSAAPADAKLMIDKPGEYELADVSVQGIAARAHIDEAGTKNATMFKIVVEDVKVAVLGHVYPDLTSSQLEDLGMVDVLVLPVGGNGYTLDAIGALKLVKAIEPKVIVPTHYNEDGLQYPVPQRALDEALHEMAMEAHETLPKLKLKHGEFAEDVKLVVLETTR